MPQFQCIALSLRVPWPATSHPSLSIVCQSADIGRLAFCAGVGWPAGRCSRPHTGAVPGCAAALGGQQRLSTNHPGGSRNRQGELVGALAPHGVQQC